MRHLYDVTRHYNFLFCEPDTKNEWLETYRQIGRCQERFSIETLIYSDLLSILSYFRINRCFSNRPTMTMGIAYEG